MLIQSIDDYFASNPQPDLTWLYHALFSAADFGLFRIGEVVHSDHIIKAKNVYIWRNKDKLIFVLFTSKSHCKNAKLQIVKIDATTSKTNPDHYPQTGIHTVSAAPMACTANLIIPTPTQNSIPRSIPTKQLNYFTYHSSLLGKMFKHFLWSNHKALYLYLS